MGVQKVKRYSFFQRDTVSHKMLSFQITVDKTEEVNKALDFCNRLWNFKICGVCFWLFTELENFE